jgi:3-oxoacyl-ACP reductase-like protein
LTVPPRTTQTAAPATDAPSTAPVPSPASSSGGGFDLADGVFVALGVLVALAAVLVFRAQRSRRSRDRVGTTFMPRR